MLKVETLMVKFHLHLAVRKIAYHSKPILAIRTQFHSSVSIAFVISSLLLRYDYDNSL